MKYRRFPLNIRKHFSIVRMTEHWHRLPKEAVESPTLEIFKSHLDMLLGSRLQEPLLEQGGWTRLPEVIPKVSRLVFCFLVLCKFLHAP